MRFNSMNQLPKSHNKQKLKDQMTPSASFQPHSWHPPIQANSKVEVANIQQPTQTKAPISCNHLINYLEVKH
jgi:hypothetical protein